MGFFVFFFLVSGKGTKEERERERERELIPHLELYWDSGNENPWEMHFPSEGSAHRDLRLGPTHVQSILLEERTQNKMTEFCAYFASYVKRKVQDRLLFQGSISDLFDSCPDLLTCNSGVRESNTHI